MLTREASRPLSYMIYEGVDTEDVEGNRTDQRKENEKK